MTTNKQPDIWLVSLLMPRAVDIDAENTPNVYVLKLTEPLLLRLRAYVTFCDVVKDQAEGWKGTLESMTLSWMGDFLRVSDKALEGMGFDVDVPDLEWGVYNHLLFNVSQENGDVTGHAVTIYPDAGVFFQCTLDDSGTLVETFEINTEKLYQKWEVCNTISNGL